MNLEPERRWDETQVTQYLAGHDDDFTFYPKC